jgi:hypothetical protein
MIRKLVLVLTILAVLVTPRPAHGGGHADPATTITITTVTTPAA